MGMLVSGAGLVMPPVPTALAAENAAAEGAEASAKAKEAPESNPYTDPSQCIYRAWDLAAEDGHKLPWFAGNAADWKAGAVEHGLQVDDTIGPDVVHAVAVWDAGAGGASWAGHVGWVAEVQGDKFLVRDRNWIPAADDERWVTWEEGISFIKLDLPEPEPAPEASAPATPEPAPQAEPAEEPAASPLQLTLDLDPVQHLQDDTAKLLQPWSPGQPATNPFML